ncbi:MAG TPA: hypothetical protein VFG24_03250 [Nitrosopumilaceae archaeon]|nr:hypothetical protein [Nitrosopumilaceae archaeon]
MDEEPSLEKMWKVIERYGIKREMFERSNPSEETILQLYQMIQKNREKNRDDETVKRLMEYIEKMKNRNKS